MTDQLYRYSALLLVCVVMIFATLAPAPARAAVERVLDVDNTLTEFDDGSFQLTASAQYPSAASGSDAVGAVQLAPVADLTSMTTSTPLTYARMNAGVVSLGSHIFVIGGIGPTQSDTTATLPRATVYVSKVDLATGGFSAWVEDDPMPKVQHSDDFADQTDFSAERSSMAVAAFSTGGENGYIYVIGGATTLDISSYSVLRATVVNGDITSWNETDPMPLIPITDVLLGRLGIESAAANIVTLPNGNTYLYLVAGLRRYYQGALVVEEISNKIYYAQLNSDGKFADAAWKTAEFAIPGSSGVWNAAVVSGIFKDANGQASNPGLYILGGQTSADPSTYSSVVTRAAINSSDGSLTFPYSGSNTGDSSQDCNSPASLGAPRTGHAAIQYNGAIYSMGGAVNGQVNPTRNVLGSYIQAMGCIPALSGSTATYFITNDGMPQPRIGHGAVAIPSPANKPTGAWVYAIGGSDGKGAVKDIYQTRIGDTSISNVRYANDGWYISKPLPIPLKNANLKKIYWETLQTGGAGVLVQFRVSADTDCSLLTNRSATSAPWQATNASSVSGSNEYPLTPLAANCFQYRAKLTPGGGTLASQTPYLKRLGIIVEVPGATDLTATGFSFYTAADGSPTGLKIDLRNYNSFIAGEPTLAADYVPGATGESTGSFFVDVFIYPPGVTPPSLEAHKPPTSPGTYARLSIDMLTKEMQAGDANNNPVQVGGAYNYTIPSDRPLCDYATAYNQQRCEPVSLAQLFPSAGVYTVVVVVDGDDNIQENPTAAGQAEDNNVYSTQVTITKAPAATGTTIFLPTISR